MGSGLNAKRKGLKQLFQAVEQGRIQQLLLTFPDRLTRFGFHYLQRYFSNYGVSIQVLDQNPPVSIQDELVQDVIAIITSFSGKLHGLRSHQKKRRLVTQSERS